MAVIVAGSKAAVVVEGRSQAETARAYGVSKGWVSKLIALGEPDDQG